ncbi:MAG: SUF system NifU family Fe-S cluster assembly protein [Acidobacterium ailaaui]|jgi:nitrogen fixation NifU-like protein|nr:SUF system NifU family Fe-S cluster assembly protein [Pseudacidobacterium ailaaui]MCL6463492.1 SUF system NifU family Fe-S cluster assembly protein [Pseudacidobacterium ailaaui]MDI3256004.1 SUF system NifU family Fe-S cluster assembly protein [Bacillota bacterium]
MGELRDLYQEVILEHSKAPRNYRELASPSARAEGFNPLCGDRCAVYLSLKDDVIEDIAFQGSGCAISRASASMMTQSLKGKTTREAEQLYEQFHAMVTGENTAGSDQIGKLAVFAGVSEFPARVKCATLAWHTFMAALHGEQQPVTTE